MKPCISEATTLPASFEDDVRAYSSAGCSAMEVWLTKLENHLQNHSVAQTEQFLCDRNMVLAAASYQGGLLLSEGEARRLHWDHFKRRLDLCQGFGIPLLLLSPDKAESAGRDIIQSAIASLREAAQWAAAFGVRLGLEFHARAPFCSNLATAAALVVACGEPNVGIVLDLFHYYTGSSKFEDLLRLAPQQLAHVQLCDLAGVPRELATDADRILPGEGDFELAALLRQLRATGYDGWVSLELFNPTLWQIPASQVAELGFRALRRLLEA